ncbi:MAG: 3-dehydroquinate synthase [Proteobacteria bacterium]|nr:MAG: 3-dehydroquinate synthase [Pseudomonadota bacterium]PIE17828.1 MAG: 3-dehydroquinate synthase [Pseudomonadota bacterium]
MKTVLELNTSQGRIPVLCGDDTPAALAALWRPRWRSAAIIGDDTTLGLFGEAIGEALRPRCDRVLALSFPPGEKHKTRQTKARLEDALLEARLERDACVVAVGGGIALDVAGFVAATTFRGLAHVNVATSLLAMIDAAIGGKTAVNTRHGKNLVGAFHQPVAVLLDWGALRSLPARELRCGWAEGIKHAWIADAALFEELEAWACGEDRRGDDTTRLLPPLRLLERCVAIKAGIVEADEREGGRRRVLNAGHTVGHALEQATEHQLHHGEAVAIGLHVEARLAALRGGLADEAVERLTRLLAALGLPTSSELPFDELCGALAHDKKNRGQALHCALPGAPGEMDPGDGGWSSAVRTAELEVAWQAAGCGGGG